MSENTGLLFDVQRSSYVDGPGLRTTVFLKGCNLRCAWCHNPEGLHSNPEYAHFAARCTGCGECLKACPRGALAEIGRPDPEKCTRCGRCALYCPAGAIHIYGKRVSAAEVVELLSRDRAYYETSGGGATFSGGECLLQPEFLLDAAERCRVEGISVAIDTAGNVPWTRFARIEPLTDWFLYDLKAFDADVHRALTGADNRLILQNLAALLERCPKKVIVRIPVIPGANDAPEDSQVCKLLALLRTLPAPKAVELLPYHRLGEGKRAALRVPEFSARIPDKARMDALRELAKDNRP